MLLVILACTDLLCKLQQSLTSQLTWQVMLHIVEWVLLKKSGHASMHACMCKHAWDALKVAGSPQQQQRDLQEVPRPLGIWVAHRNHEAPGPGGLHMPAAIQGN